MMDDRELLRKELTETRLAYYKATEMSKFKAGFLARTAHELRSPLATIISLHQLILADLCENPQEEKEFIEQAHQAALKLTQLLDRTIFVSQLEDGRIEIEKESFSSIDWFADIRQAISLQAANRNVRLNFNQNIDSDCDIVGDRGCLLQMLVLLLESAILQVKVSEISLSATTIPTTAMMRIDVQLASSAQIWLESADLLRKKIDISPISVQSITHHKNDFSPGMKFLLAQQMLEMMGGSLELTEISTEDSQPLTQLSFSLPLA
jgi:signal transduction histidine kinase